ncbi:MAG: nucleoside hydrolase [Alphaproteobacteria bacterium]|nr:nucleoside hydrolase [Alphaproteobacteria bacterium]
MRDRFLAAVVLVIGIALAGPGAGAGSLSTAPKIILDTDFNSMGDDGQLLVMTAQLMAEGKVNLLGITTVSGNDWLLQANADALKAVERLGIDKRVGVYSGANYPREYHPDMIADHRARFPGYYGAWRKIEPTPMSVAPPPDGSAVRTKLKGKGAVDYIIETIKANPNEITLFVVGPVTNIAAALDKAPEIEPLVKEIVYMGSAFEVRGNATPVASINWWFDPVAVRKLLQTRIRQTVITNDVTNTVRLTQEVLDAIANNPAKQTAVTQFFKNRTIGGTIADTLTLPYFLDNSFATVTTDAWLDIDTKVGDNWGRVTVYKDAPGPGASPNRIRYVSRFDNARFYELYIDLMTRPVPVTLPPY